MTPENESDLPVHLEEVVARLRRTKPAMGGVLDRLLAKWSAADSFERERIEGQIVQLAKPNIATRAIFAVFGFVLLAVGYYLYAEHRLSASVDEGVRALARVERLTEGFCLVGTKQTTCVDLALVVHARGRAPFRASLTRSLSLRWLSRVQPGNTIVVAIDRDDPTVVYIDEAALEAPPPPPLSSE